MTTARHHRTLKLVSIALAIVLMACIAMPVCSVKIVWTEMDDTSLTEQDRLYNNLPHEYLAGYYSEDLSEITITGMKITETIETTRYLYRKDIVIPDEIDGVPVTTIAESAFEFYADQYCIPAIYSPDAESVTLRLGKNIRHICKSAFSNVNEVIVGKYDYEDYSGFYGAHHISCYPDSGLHRAITQTSPFKDHYIYTERTYGYSLGYALIDESHLVSDVVEIDEKGTVYLPYGVTQQTLGDFVSVDGTASIRVLGDTIEDGTKIELVNSTYGTVDNTYTVALTGAPHTLTVESCHAAYAGTTFCLETNAQTFDAPTYTSDNPDVACVDANGNVTAHALGTARITVTATDEESGVLQTAVCTVPVIDRAVLVSDTEVIDEQNKVYLPYGVTKQTLENYVSVDGNAEIRVYGAEVVSQVKLALVNRTYGTIDNIYTVVLEEPRISLTVEPECVVYGGDTFTPVVSVQTNGTPCRLTYLSYYSCVRVDKNGFLTATSYSNKPESTQLTVTATDECGFSKSAECTVIVLRRSVLYSDKVTIDDNKTIYLPSGATAQTLPNYVSVSGGAAMHICGDTIEDGTKIELVNRTYGTVDNVYTVVLEEPQITLTVEPAHTMYAKTTFSIHPTVQTNGTPCTLSYTCDNPEVACVDANGNVAANKSGTAAITVTATDEGGFTRTAVCVLTVIDRARLVSDTAEIDENMNVHLPIGVTKQTLPNYVSVVGGAAMRICGDTIEDGTKIELVNRTYGRVDNVYTVVLEEPQITLTVEPAHTMYAKTTFSMQPTVQTNGTPCTLSYTSDNPEVAAVDANGNVAANKSGTAVITVTATDEGGFTRTAVCTVTVRYTWWQWLVRIFLFGWLWY